MDENKIEEIMEKLFEKTNIVLEDKINEIESNIDK